MTSPDDTCTAGGDDTFYLFNDDQEFNGYGDWIIATELGSNTRLAYCSTGSTETDITSCDGSWYTAGSTDSDITVSYTDCPEWDCDIITTSFDSDHICQVDFNEKMDTNVWRGYNNLVTGSNPFLIFSNNS